MIRWLFSVCFLLVMAGAAAAETQRQIGARLAEVIAAIKADDWDQADRLAARLNDGPAETYFEWRSLRAGRGAWRDYLNFLNDHADWPGLPLLARVGEAKIPENAPAAAIQAYFEAQPPQTGRGAALLARQLSGAAQAAIVARAWGAFPMPANDVATLWAEFPKITQPLAWARTDHLIWEGEFSRAAEMLPYLDAGHRALAEARIALRRGQRNGVNALINKIPAGIAAKSAGLRFDRFRWRMRRDIWAGAEEILRQSSASRESLGRPDVWSRRRATIARRAMRAGRHKTAYDFARRHHLKPGETGFVDLEWLAGYIALRHLKRPDDAVTHFRRLRVSAVTPITSGRVWYWLGRAHEAAGNRAKAAEADGLAARKQTSFYGQLGAERGKLPDDPAIASGTMVDWKSAGFLASDVFRAGLLLHYADERYEGGRFFAHLAETLDENSQRQLGQFLVDLERPNMALRVAKNAARLGRVTINSYYPITPLAALAKDVPPEVVMAIARQETELNPDVVSPVGALGLMQVMPKTARGVARSLGVAYQGDRMLTDWRYNARFGIAYLGQMIARYDGSYLLAAAAYNAGPGRADRWIKEFGDPRRGQIDPVDWIELIPFRETRNYVQRVLESTNVYRARLSGRASGLRIGEDLARGGSGG